MEPRLHGQATAAYDANTYLTIMVHPGTPFGKPEYLTAAALYDRRFLIHRDGEQTVIFDNTNETNHFWLQNGHRELVTNVCKRGTNGCKRNAHLCLPPIEKTDEDPIPLEPETLLTGETREMTATVYKLEGVMATSLPAESVVASSVVAFSY